MGSLKESNGKMVVQSDLRLSTAADIVADPSAPEAFVKGIMENVEWLYDPVHNTWHEHKLHETKKKIHNMSKSQLEEQRLAILEDYIASLAINNKFI
jgi:outer membrane protease